jgi:hypothetical protein
MLGALGDQLGFASALALTRTAEEYNREEASALPQYFTVRNSWVSKGFRVDRASKRNLVATAFHKDPFMGLQATGGTKTPSAGKKTVAVPVIGGARRTLQSTTPRSKWPGRLKGSFVITTPKGDKLVAVRQGKRGRRKKRKIAFNFATDRRAKGQKDPRVRVMYLLESSVRMRKRWPYADVGHAGAYFHRRFPANIDGYLRAAFRNPNFHRVGMG